jgi:hypothetical protein
LTGRDRSSASKTDSIGSFDGGGGMLTTHHA